MATAQDFAREYELALLANVMKEPEKYRYTPEEVPKVAAKMIAAFKAGNANTGSAMKTAAHACGIKPTLAAVKALLNSNP